jgi:hypothetical protein
MPKEEARAKKREESAAEAEQQREKDVEKLYALHSRLEDRHLTKLHEVTERRKSERARRLAAQLLSADAGTIEFGKWSEMERGQQNTVLRDQNESLQEDQRHRRLVGTCQRIREDGIQGTFEAATTRRRNADDLLCSKLFENTQRRLEEETVFRAAIAKAKTQLGASHRSRVAPSTA